MAAPLSDAIALQLEFPDNRLMIDLVGPGGAHLAQIEQLLGVQIVHRGNALFVHGDAAPEAERVLNGLYARLEAGKDVTMGVIDGLIRLREGESEPRDGDQGEMFPAPALEIRTRKKTMEPRTEAQKAYTQALLDHELTFGIGPAGTGKTYIAVAVAVSKFLQGEVDRIILTRPAVEAGEKLGFLPGTQDDKIDPYMQPLYDALNDFLPGKQLIKLREERQVEIAPLAFMRGRTLNNAFVILDEAQNATTMQMKMFLTRLGQGSRMAITGDRSQVDLPRGVYSGLRDAESILKGVDGISFNYFTAADVVRHPLVAKIITAYEADDTRREAARAVRDARE
ncbi:phosphate starvation-inducible protein PhoH [Jannaschia seohaensis]|uniref:PhoH-like protein n=2 Tax=Jannaschia seohaensis TaxID=475081 RepID=A0A2Y9B5R4_9RHOB|nr:phosphate starvation-inducible protein PhoH [Jannaschia seohaensis]SSA51750.1 phosphate starvation-inducible protein PhoH [Jannaschia seohaensis]